MHVFDLHATFLHQLGIDHEQLRSRSRVKTRAGVEEAHVVRGILA